MTFKQADETLLHVNYVANSQYSFYTTTDGRVLLRDSVGNLCYAKQIGNQLINKLQHAKKAGKAIMNAL